MINPFNLDDCKTQFSGMVEQFRFIMSRESL
jgi:hypothetical protein